MRPRPDAAENFPLDGCAGQGVRFNEAAARCRGKPLLALWPDAPVRAASMRPRPDAAENAPSGAAGNSRDRRFNEAAARCRGKRPRMSGDAPDPGASMRPRPDAAENAGQAARSLRPARASMRPRPDAAENVRPDVPDRPRPDRFNEAAARCRGKLLGRGQPRPDLFAASMRPRPDAAENRPDEELPAGVHQASMRPRPDAAENPGLGPRLPRNRVLQ